MAASHYSRGREVEWKIKHELEENEWHVIRASSSKGVWDIVGVRLGFVRLISSKRAKTRKIAARTLAKERKQLAPYTIEMLIPFVDQELWVWCDEREDGSRGGEWFYRGSI